MWKPLACAGGASKLSENHDEPGGSEIWNLRYGLDLGSVARIPHSAYQSGSFCELSERKKAYILSMGMLLFLIASAKRKRCGVLSLEVRKMGIAGGL